MTFRSLPGLASGLFFRTCQGVKFAEYFVGRGLMGWGSGRLDMDVVPWIEIVVWMSDAEIIEGCGQRALGLGGSHGASSLLFFIVTHSNIFPSHLTSHGPLSFLSKLPYSSYFPAG